MPNTRSDILVNALADPLVTNKIAVDGGRLRTKIAKFTIDISADGPGHIYQLARFKPTDSIISLQISHDGLATGVNDTNWGVRTPAPTPTDDPVQISAAADSVFSDAYDMSTLSVSWTEILGLGATAAPLELNAGLPIWEAAGLSADPGPQEYIATMISVGDPATADEAVAVKFVYVAGD